MQNCYYCGKPATHIVNHHINLHGLKDNKDTPACGKCASKAKPPGENSQTTVTPLRQG